MSIRYMFLALLLTLVVALTGCPKPEKASTGPAVTPPVASAGANATPAGITGELATCSVLGTTMPKDKMIPVEYKGKTYYFCCQDCVPKFKADPEKYIKNPAKPLPPSAGM